MKKNILVVDDSALMRRVICDIINSDERFHVQDTCKDGVEAFEMLKVKKFDVVLLDINMPRMTGLELLDKLNENHIRATVIMVSTLTSKGAEETLLAMEKGAVDFVLKPENLIEARGRSFKDTITKVICAVTKIDTTFEERLSALKRQREESSFLYDTQPVMRAVTGKPFSIRDNRGSESISHAASKPEKRPKKTSSEPVFSKERKSESPKSFAFSAEKNHAERSEEKQESAVMAGNANSSNTLIALACSTGGPKALHEVIPGIPANIDAPMVIVQHMPVGFTKLLSERLNLHSKAVVKEAEEGEILKKGVVYIAPGGYHLEIQTANGGNHKIHLSTEEAIDGLRPCANVMYRSLERSKFKKIVCVVLTGMGSDGTKGILSLKKKKNIHVISQNEQTCVVYGMPKAIADAGIVDEVVPLQNIAKTITKNTGVR